MPGLEPLRYIGNTQLEFAEFRDASAQNGTLAFRAAAAQNDIGVHFTHGLHFMQSYVSVVDRTVTGALHFLPSTSSDSRTVSSGAVAAAVDEILSDMAWRLDCAGFTASLTIQPCVDHAGNNIAVPVAKTLRYIGEANSIQKTSKGGMKCCVFGTLSSADGATVYARASAVFVQPAGVPTPSELEHKLKVAGSQEEANAIYVADAEAKDAVLQRTREHLRLAALETMRASLGALRFVTHLPNFETSYAQWAGEHCCGRFHATNCALDVPELNGKVFMALSEHVSGAPLLGIVKFSACAQGPPSSAHGGSRFAVLQHAAMQLCRAEIGTPFFLDMCEVKMKAQLPLDVTIKVEVGLAREKSGTCLMLEGRLVDLEGKVVYDILTATARCAPATIETCSTPTMVASSRL